MATSTFAGPVDYAVFAFPKDAQISPGLAIVLDSVAAGIIDLLDVEAVTIGADSRPKKIPLDSFQEANGVDMNTFIAAQAALLDEEDLLDVVTELDEGQFALVIVYEDRTLAAAANAFAHIGGVEVFSGAIDIADLHSAIEKERTA